MYPEHPLGQFQHRRKQRTRKPLIAPTYRGGRTFVDDAGYVHEYAPDHPNCNGRGYVPQHRLVAEGMLGRLLTPDETVHHRQVGREHRTNNDPSNLEVMSKQDHMKLHVALGKRHYDEAQVAALLAERSIFEVADLLDCHHQTLRNRFPHLVPENRKRPSRPYPQELVDRVGLLAADPNVSLRNAQAQLGITRWKINRILDQAGLRWTGKRGGRPASASRSR